jgi:curli biogenesis system outer membrane secretion channel CsgG
MQTTIGKVMTLVMGIALMGLVISCASTGTQSMGGEAVAPKSGFLKGYYEKLTPGQAKGDPKLMWIKPGVDYSKYKKVMVDYVIFALSNDSEYKGIDANEMKKLGDGASRALVNALKKEFPVVAEPGPDVIRIRTAIVDLKQSHPALSGVTSVVPVGLAINLVKKGSTDSWTGSGATTAEMMVLDSTTNDVLGAGEDDMAAGFTERFTKWGSVEEAFEFWGERLAKRLVRFTHRK